MLDNRDLIVVEDLSSVDPRDIFGHLFDFEAEDMPKSVKSYLMFGAVMNGVVLDFLRMEGLDPSKEPGFKNFPRLVHEADAAKKIEEVRMAILLLQYGTHIADRVKTFDLHRKESALNFSRWLDNVLRTVDPETLKNLKNIRRGVKGRVANFYHRISPILATKRGYLED